MRGRPHLIRCVLALALLGCDRSKTPTSPEVATSARETTPTPQMALRLTWTFEAQDPDALAEAIEAASRRAREFAQGRGHPVEVSADQGRLEVALPGLAPEALEEWRELLAPSGRLCIRSVASRGAHSALIEDAPAGTRRYMPDFDRGGIRAEPPLDDAGLAALRAHARELELGDVILHEDRIHLVTPTCAIGAEAVQAVDITRDETFGQPLLAMTLTEKGARAFHALTREHVREPLVMEVDGQVRSMPVVREPIPGPIVHLTPGAGQLDLFRTARLNELWLEHSYPAGVTATLEREEVIE